MKIGKGKYSKVYKIDSSAVKKYKNDLKDGIPLDLIREVAVLKYVQSPYIINLLDVGVDYIVLPYYEYDLSQYLKNGGRVNKEFLYTFLYAIDVLHSHGIMHRDIKPSNILVKNQSRAVLIDFGFSRRVEIDRNYGPQTPGIITSWYRPPEVIDGKRYGFEADVWSAGCIIAEVHLETHLFNFSTDLEILEYQCYLMGTPKNYFTKIIVNEYEGVFNTKMEKFSDELRHLLKGMLKINHKERFNISMCLNSRYFNDCEQLEAETSSKTSTKPEHSNKPSSYLEKLENYKHKLDFYDTSLFSMREILVLWMLEVCNSYKLSDSTYFRSVIILDTFISENMKRRELVRNSELVSNSENSKASQNMKNANNSLNVSNNSLNVSNNSLNVSSNSLHISKDNFQLVGMACLWIASKLESLYLINKDNLIFACDDAFTIKQLELMEKTILITLDFNLITPTLNNYLSLYSQIFDMNEKEEKLLNKYMHICTIYPDMYTYKFSELVLFCARTVKNLDYIDNPISKWLKKDFKEIDERFD